MSSNLFFTSDANSAGDGSFPELEIDLDHNLCFNPVHLKLLKNKLVCYKNKANPNDFQEWTLGPDSQFEAIYQHGLGTLKITLASGVELRWNFTTQKKPQVYQFIQDCKKALGVVLETITTICPGCGGILKTDELCLTCNPLPAQKGTSLKMLLRLFEFSKPQMPLIVLGFFLTLFSTLVGLIPPYLVMPLTDDVLIPMQQGKLTEFSPVFYYIGLLALAGAATCVLEWARSFFSSWVSERISASLRMKTYAHLHTLSVEYFGSKRTGDIMSRISSDTNQLCNFLSSHVVDFASDVLMVLLTAVTLFAINPFLAMASLIPFPFITFLAYKMRGHLLRGYRKGSIVWADMTSVLADTIPGIRVVKAFSQEKREIQRFDHANSVVVATNDHINFWWAIIWPLITFITTLGLLIVWVAAAWQIFKGHITVGVLTAFLAYISRFYSRSESMIRFMSYAQRASASAGRLFEILDRKPSVPEPSKPIAPNKLGGDIDIRNLRFSYGSREVLHGISLSIRKGEMIGIVGPSGAGKTTLINLICRFFDPSHGSISVDGTDIRSFPVSDYRRNIGIVLQDPFLFFGSIADNISYGKPGATRKEIIDAARFSKAHPFILNLPEAYDSLVGERGQSLSGGERQRVSIARALLVNPGILILDEATSALDAETEKELQAALENLVEGRTTIAIAHRLSTLRRADRLIVMDNGTIAETGTHAELLQKEGLYFRLHKAQQMLAAGYTI